jgi:hypothetical protein
MQPKGDSGSLVNHAEDARASASGALGARLFRRGLL